MKQYVIDELRKDDYERLYGYLEKVYEPDPMGDIFWVPLGEELLNPVQKAHRDCRPFYLAIELTRTALSLELLVRTKKRIRCDCMGYADSIQRGWAMDMVDRMIRELKIIA